jgi:hypothetical protein
MFRGTLAAVLLPCAALLLCACNSSPRPVTVPVSSPRAVNGPVPQAALAARASIRGFDDICGISVTPPRRAVVRAFDRGRVVASARVIAGNPNRDRYQLAVPPGRYRVVASNWDRRGQRVTVDGGGRVTVNFVNGCY